MIYIAGVVHAPPRKETYAAAGLFANNGDNRNIGKCLPKSGERSQYVAELYAALEAVRSVSRNTKLTVVSTQNYVQDAMNKKLASWEHIGWVGVQHRDILRCLAAELNVRRAPTIFKVAGPGTRERAMCGQAAKLAKRAAKTSMNGEWDLTLPQGSTLPGLSLQDNRQRVFYRSIREEKVRALAPRPSTVKKLEEVRHATENAYGKIVSDADIWKATAVRDILPRTAQFLWKGLHNAHRIGNYWTHIPECEERALCKECETMEDLEHILTGCRSPRQEIVWRAAEALWLEKESAWPTVSLGTILGCGLAEFRDDKGKLKRGTQRLYRILISESAYLIWKLRNDRVISNNLTM
jgi:ribonuclease HI